MTKPRQDLTHHQAPPPADASAETRAAVAVELQAAAIICREHGAAALANAQDYAVARAITDALYALGARFDTRADQWANG